MKITQLKSQFHYWIFRTVMVPDGPKTNPANPSRFQPDYVFLRKIRLFCASPRKKNAPGGKIPAQQL